MIGDRGALNSGRLLGWASALTLLSFWLLPYQYGTGNHHAYIPHLQHLLDPNLYPRDELIESFRAIPSAYWRLLSRLETASGIAHGWWLHASAGLSRLVLVLALLHLGRRVFELPARWALVLTILALPAQLCAAAVDFGVASSPMTQTSFALGAETLALSLLASGRPVPAYALLAAACPFHAQSAVLLSGIFVTRSALAAFAERADRRTIVRHLIGISLFAASMAAVSFRTPTPAPLTTDAFTEYQNAMSWRIAHHSFPLLWGAGDWIHVAAAPLIVASACWDPRRSHAVRWLCAAAVLAFSGWTLVQLVGVHGELVQSRLPIILAPMRSGKWLLPIALALIAQLGRESLDATAWHRTLWFVGCALVLIEPKVGMIGMAGYAWLSTAAERLGDRVPSLRSKYMLLLVAGHMLAMTASKLLLGQRAESLVWSLLAAAPLCTLSLLLLRRARRPSLMIASGLLAVLVTDPRGKLMSGDSSLMQRAPSELQAVARAAERSVPIDGRILSPPDVEGFRLHSRRSIVGDWKDGGYHSLDPSAAIRWARLMGRLLTGDERTFIANPARRGQPRPNRWHDWPLEQLLALASDNHAEFVVVRSQSRAAREFERMRRDGPAARDLALRELYRNEEYLLLAIVRAGRSG